MKTTLLATSLCLALCPCGFAADAKQEAGTYLTLEQARAAGPDIDLQGEYAREDEKIGAQVIALGNDTFRLVIHKGGLPGAGWNKSPKVEIEAKRGEEGGIRFVDAQGKDYSVVVQGGKTALRMIGAAGLRMDVPRVQRQSPTLGAKPPAGAIVLFDGTSFDAFAGGHEDDLKRKLLAPGCKTKRDDFQNYTLHCEFLLPFKPLGRGQGRANSGVYMQDRYEVQVLDSFGLKGLNNECGGLYSKAAPSVNMCFPPLVWQTYDIDFEAAKFDAEGKKTNNAVITVKHNGVVIHDKQEINGPTGGGKKEDTTGGAIQLQGHGNPVFYRNVWIVVK